jgi:hypothetical protein
LSRTWSSGAMSESLLLGSLHPDASLEFSRPGHSGIYGQPLKADQSHTNGRSPDINFVMSGGPTMANLSDAIRLPDRRLPIWAYTVSVGRLSLTSQFAPVVRDVNWMTVESRESPRPSGGFECPR